MTARRLEGKRCLITGGTRGLGLAMAKAFTRHGARVAITYRRDRADADAAVAALTALGGEPLVYQGSVADAAHATATVAAVNAAWGGIDVLVNNAGVTQVLPMALIEEADWDLVMDTNAKGAFLFARAVLRGMIRARAGHILNIGTAGSERVLEAPIHYAAAKAALRGLTDALAREVGRYNIQVNLLAPGLLDVGMGQMLPKHRIGEYVEQASLGRLGKAEELAEIAAFLVSDENRFMAAAKIVADGGL
ncbi:MAG: SDR family oxidoreductase [Deltaproteobacteria bacterium]|nr:SDR family oxidoreductase [Deltaproteobacteria bacterium]